MIIRATSCPSLALLAERYSILVTERFPSALGATELGFLGEVSLVDDGWRIERPFSYQAAWVQNGGRVGLMRMLAPACGLDLDDLTLCVTPIYTVHLSAFSPRALADLRESLLPAWDGWEHLRTHGGRVELAERAPG